MKVLAPYPPLPRSQRLRSLLRKAAGAGVATTLVASFLTAGFCKTPWEALHLVACILATLARTLRGYVSRGCTPLFPTWTLRFELVRAVLRLCSSWKGHRIADPTHARIIRWQTELLGSVSGWLSCRFAGGERSVVERVRVNGLEHLWLRSARPRGGADPASKLVVLYLHGGGYAVLSPHIYISFCHSLKRSIQAHLAGRVPLDTEVDVFIANYRKIPEHKFPVPALDALAMYDYLLTHERLAPSQIVLVGDSAGGGLVMSTLLRVRDRALAGAGLPLAAIVLCPFVDLTGDEDDGVSEHCVLSTRIIHACRSSLLRESPSSCLLDQATWQDASAVHSDLRGLPPVFVQAARLDYLFQHAVRLVDKARADGATDWVLDVHEDVPHVFPVFPAWLLPYAAVGIDRMAAFAAEQFANRPTRAAATDAPKTEAEEPPLAPTDASAA